MSELGEIGVPNAIVMNTLGTPLLGVSIILFALTLYAGLEKTRISQAASAFARANRIDRIPSLDRISAQNLE